MDKLLANYTVNALQELVEACQLLGADLPPERRAKLDKLLNRVRQAKASMMAEMM